MTKYQEARVNLTNTQLNKLKSSAKYKAGTILRLNNKHFEHEELPHELLFLTRQTTKIRNAFGNDNSTEIKHNKAQISKINKSRRSFDCWLANLGKKVLTSVAIPSVRDNLPRVVRNLTSNAINNFEWKRIGKGAARAGKGFTLFLSNEDMNDSIKIIKSLKYLGVSIDRVTEIVKYKIKKQDGGFPGVLLASLATSLLQPVISSLVKHISGIGVRRTGIRYKNKNV